MFYLIDRALLFTCLPSTLFSRFTRVELQCMNGSKFNEEGNGNPTTRLVGVIGSGLKHYHFLLLLCLASVNSSATKSPLRKTRQEQRKQQKTRKKSLAWVTHINKNTTHSEFVRSNIHDILIIFQKPGDQPPRDTGLRENPEYICWKSIF